MLVTCDFPWTLDREYQVKLRVAGAEITAWVDGKEVLAFRDESPLALRSGAIAVMVDTGSIATGISDRAAVWLK